MDKQLMRHLFALILSIAPTWGATCTLPAGTYATLAATSGVWTGCGALPVAGDIAVISSGADVHITSGESLILGSTASGVGVALTIHGTNSSTYGSLTVDAGGTLTLRGYDANANKLAVVDRYAYFTLHGTLLGEMRASVTGFFQCAGICTLQGTPEAHATVSIPASLVNWNTAATPTGPSGVNNNMSTQPGPYFLGGNVYLWKLTDMWISNAGGTDIGSAADSSVSFSGISCSPACTGADAILTTPVSSLTDVNGAGKYYVDHALGYVYWWQATGPGATVTFSASFKKLTYTSWHIEAISSSDHNQLTADYTDFTYIGPASDAGGVWALYATYKRPDTTLQNFSVRNCIFTYCRRPIGIGNMTGTALDPIHIEDNVFTAVAADDGSGYGGSAVFSRYASTQVSVARNTFTGRGYFYFGYVGPQTAISIKNNVIGSDALVKSSSDATTWPDSVIEENLIRGRGASTVGGYTTWMWAGSSGHPSTLSRNIYLYCYRWANFYNYNIISDNFVDHIVHHGLMSAGTSGVWGTGVTVSGNILVRFTSGAAAPLEATYNIGSLIDGLTVRHNVMDGNQGYSGWDWGDGYDSGGPGPNTSVNVTFSDNLITNNAYGVRRTADTANLRTRNHILQADYNNVYGNSTDFSGWSRFATFTGLANVTGVSLQTPSYSTAFAGKTLTYTYTSPSNISFTWDGGAPVSMIMAANATGTATGTQSTTTLQDTSKAWPTASNDANCPKGGWVVITAGTGVGQVRRITTATANTLTVVPAWTTTPIAADSQYVIYLSQITLTAGNSATIEVGIDARSLPASSQSDTVSMSLHSLSVDPQYVDRTRTLESWDASLGGSGTEESWWARLTANPALIGAALDYLRGGWAVTNPVLRGAASDGTIIGTGDGMFGEKFNEMFSLIWGW